MKKMMVLATLLATLAWGYEDESEVEGGTLADPAEASAEPVPMPILPEDPTEPVEQMPV